MKCQLKNKEIVGIGETACRGSAIPVSWPGPSIGCGEVWCPDYPEMYALEPQMATISPKYAR